MRAAWYEESGDAGVLRVGEMPDPEPGPGEVRVRVMVSGINPSDWKMRARAMRFPRIIPNQDGSGVIDSVGEGVPSSRIGERVWLYESNFGRPFGTAAEFTVQPAHHAVPLPENASFADGACLGVPAMTAHRSVFADGPVTDRTVLVTGGAGAVGNYAIQMAKIGGARVFATISSDEKARIARDAGADEIINYRNEDVTGRINELTGDRGVDRIVEVEFPANFEVSRKALADNGAMAVYGFGDGDAQPPGVPFRFRRSNINVRFVMVYTMPPEAKRAAIEHITQWISNGTITHLHGPHFTLEQAADASRAVESHAIGTVMLDVGVE
ncbi:MAG: NADPH:quinone reductase [Dehalococcoidia bacterium]|jgi:NADPH2:quinone reductase|nr:NADPH:quinone reductase [Dehalococcoidia bacterium]